MLVNDKMMDEFLITYKNEMDSLGFDISESDYALAKNRLENSFDATGLKLLNEVEELCKENIKYALGFGFERGLYAGFQQYFIEETTDLPFYNLVVNELLTEPKMQKYTEYYNRRSNFNEMYGILEKESSNEIKEHIISVMTAWDDRLYGALRHSFYHGYQYALKIIDKTEYAGATMTIINKTLIVRNELGFDSTK